MGIQVKCAKCGKVLSVSEKHAGRRGKCPACSAPFVVPEPPPPAPPTAGKSVTFEVKRVLSGLPPKKIPAVLTLTREELSVTGGDIGGDVRVPRKDAAQFASVLALIGARTGMLRLKNVAPKTIGLEVTADVMKAMEDWLPFSLPPVWKTLIVPSWAVLPVAAMLIVGGIIGAVKGEESVGAAMVAIGLSVAAAAAINLVVSYRQRNKQKLRLQAGNQPDPFERHLTGG